MSKIDLVIPCYNTHATLYRALGSIMEQKNREDIHVILVDDASDKPYDDMIAPFKDILDIELIRCDVNGGPGVARRIGMEAGKSKYIMFMDSDDTFFHSLAIQRLYDFIESEKCDIVYSTFLEETERGDFIAKKADMIWVFGKIYSRQFLNKYKITFNDSRQNEDNGFNTLTRCFTNPKILDEATYIWHYNPNSITRDNNGLYLFTCNEGQVFNKAWAFREGYKKGWPKEPYIRNIIGQFCFYYFEYFLFLHNTRQEIDINLYLKWIKQFYDEFEKEITEAFEKDIWREEYKINLSQYSTWAKDIPVLEITIQDFIKKLQEI